MEQDMPKRKALRLKKYNYNSKGAYFITICVKDRQRLLSRVIKSSALSTSKDVDDLDFSNFNINDIQIELTDIGKIIEKTLLSSEKISGVKIDRYVIMPDHIHAMIFLDPAEFTTLSKTSKTTNAKNEKPNEMLPRIVSAFKRICHKKIGCDIFQRGYVEHVVRDKEDYKTRIKYMYENPLRWYYNELKK